MRALFSTFVALNVFFFIVVDSSCDEVIEIVLATIHSHWWYLSMIGLDLRLMQTSHWNETHSPSQFMNRKMRDKKRERVRDEWKHQSTHFKLLFSVCVMKNFSIVICWHQFRILIYIFATLLATQFVFFLCHVSYSLIDNSHHFSKSQLVFCCCFFSLLFC